MRLRTDSLAQCPYPHDRPPGYCRALGVMINKSFWALTRRLRESQREASRIHGSGDARCHV